MQRVRYELYINIDKIVTDDANHDEELSREMLDATVVLCTENEEQAWKRFEEYLDEARVKGA